MLTLEFYIGLAIGTGIAVFLCVAFLFWATHIYEKVSQKHYNNYANRIEAAVKNLERKAAEK